MKAPSVQASADRGATVYLDLDDAALLAQCHVDTYRASGPGGQKRNKTDSAVRLRHQPTGLIAIGTESRSQHENKARALRRMRKMLALSIRTTIDPNRYEPSPLLKSCISNAGRLQVGQKDQRYLRVAGEILDVLAGCAMQLSTAAALIGVSTANLGAFLSKDGALLDCVNRTRTAAGLHPLRRSG